MCSPGTCKTLVYFRKKKNIFLKIPFIQPVEFYEGSHVKHKLFIMKEKSLWSVFPELSINMDYFSFWSGYMIWGRKIDTAFSKQLLRTMLWREVTVHREDCVYTCKKLSLFLQDIIFALFFFFLPPRILLIEPENCVFSLGLKKIKSWLNSSLSAALGVSMGVEEEGCNFQKGVGSNKNRGARCTPETDLLCRALFCLHNQHSISVSSPVKKKCR